MNMCLKISSNGVKNGYYNVQQIWVEYFSIKKCPYFLSIFLLCFLFFYGCSKKNEDVESQTNGNVSVDVQPFIQFKTKLVDSSKTGIFHDATFKLNDADIKARYTFSNVDKLVVFFPKTLKAKTDYTLIVPMKEIAKTLNIAPKISDISLHFTTNPIAMTLESDLEFKNASMKETKLYAKINFSQNIDLDSLVKSITLQDNNKNNIALTITPSNENTNEFSLVSALIPIPQDTDKQYNLHIDSKLLGLKEDKDYPILLPANSELAITQAKAQPGEKPSIALYFSNELAKNINLKDFIQISPEVDFSAAQSGNIVYLTGNFTTQVEYQISVSKGIKSINDKTLKQNYSTTLTINDIAPAISFSSTGVFLPQSSKKKLAFKTMNVNKVHVAVSRIYPNNLTQFLYDGNLIGSNGYNSDVYYNMSRLGDTVFKKDFAINNTKNTWIQNELDLSSLKDSSGIFVVELSFNKEDTDYRFSKQDDSEDIWGTSYYTRSYWTTRKHLIFSNIALMAQSGDGKLTITALNITNNAPLANVKISAVNSKNQVIAQANTNASGDAVINVKKSEVLYLLAQSGENSTILKLDSGLSNDGFDVSGEEVSSGIKSFIYTDRGVYRPGDDMHLNVIVRNNDVPLPQDHPIYLSITSPRDKKIVEDYALHQVSDGMYYYDFKIPKDADTGVWNARINVGGNVFYKDISIETIVPDRIKALINTQETLDIQHNKKLDYSLQGNYLFGAPASDLDYSVSMYVRTQEFHSKLYPNYSFNTDNSMNYSYNDNAEGKLDSQGFIQKSFNLSNIPQTNTNLRATLVAKISEKSGRSVSTRKNVLLKQYDSFVGIGMLNNYDNIDLTQEIKIPVIAIAADDSKLIAGRKLVYKIYRNSYSWWWDYDSYSDFTRSIKTDKNTEMIAEGELISKDTPVYLSKKLDGSGDFLVEVTDAQNGVSSAISFHARQWGEPSNAKKISALKITTDKNEYLPGQNATITFESIANTKALVTLNKNGKILKRFWVNTQDNKTSVEIPITRDLAPNAYVNVSLLQNYNTTDNDRSLRLYGVVPLMVKDSNTALTLNIQAPKEIQPDSDFEVKISNQERQKATFTLAIVDEGLLSLTDFKTPNPWKYFYSKLALALETFDTYDLIIGKTFGKVHNVLSTGGDEDVADSNARQKRDENAERFKPVVLYTAPMSTDDNGNATLKFKMPTYIGKVRIMLIASSPKAIASAESEISVTSPVVMLPTLPRVLKAGDKFSLPIEVFATNPTLKEAKIQISTEKGLVTFDKKEVLVKFNASKSQTINFDGVVTNAIGTEKINIVLSSKDSTFKDSTEIDIKSVNPYITQAQKFILPANKSLSVSAPKDFILGSNKGFISISSTPIISLDHRLRWLIHYPYGCIEQTTSSVLPQLFIDKLSNAKFIDKQELDENINAGIRRIQRFQVSNGGFSYWQGDTESDAWGSNYAGHFLILAQKHGYFVPQELMKRWKNYEINSVKSNSNKYAYTRIYSLYLLALLGDPQIGIMNEIYEDNLKSLSVTDKWLLAATYKLAGMSDVAEKIAKDLSIIPDSTEQSYFHSYGSVLRDKAMILSSYYTIYGKNNESLFNDIVKELEQDSWLSTQTLGYSLLTLSSIKENAKNVEMIGTIDLNKKKESFKQLSSQLQYKLDKGQAIIQSQTPQDLYISYVWEGIPGKDSMPQLSKNLVLTREFLNQDGQNIDVTHTTSGQSFWIKLKLSGVNTNVKISNIALTQALPSGWEIENTRLNNDALPQFINRNSMDLVAYTDIRDDKIMWFFNYDSHDQNAQEVYVKINVVTPGEFVLPPAYAEAMYNNAYQASTTSMQVKVEK